MQHNRERVAQYMRSHRERTHLAFSRRMQISPPTTLQDSNQVVELRGLHVVCTERIGHRLQGIAELLVPQGSSSGDKANNGVVRHHSRGSAFAVDRKSRPREQRVAEIESGHLSAVVLGNDANLLDLDVLIPERVQGAFGRGADR